MGFDHCLLSVSKPTHMKSRALGYDVLLLRLQRSNSMSYEFRALFIARRMNS